MSLVAFAKDSQYVAQLLLRNGRINIVGRSTVTVDDLREVAAKNNIIVPEHDVEGYLAVLQSAEETAATVDALPDYIDPRLLPTPTLGGVRRHSRPLLNDMNAWSHQTSLLAVNPSSNLLCGRQVLVKDNMSLGGVPYTCGTFPELIVRGSTTHPLSPIDATVVQRLLDSGVTISGTATCEKRELLPDTNVVHLRQRSRPQPMAARVQRGRQQ
jgi:amidase